MKTITKEISEEASSILSASDRARFTRLFNSSEKLSSGCIHWSGRKNENGYGLFDYSGKPRLAHRVSFWLHTGPIPAGVSVLHRCDNPACVNPAHLFQGTHQDNMKDMVAKGRQAQGDAHRKLMRRVAASGHRHMSVTSPETVRRGSMASGARLTEAEVVQIRERYANGEIQRHLAAAFGINQSQVSDVVTRTTWKHVA